MQKILELWFNIEICKRQLKFGELERVFFTFLKRYKATISYSPWRAVLTRQEFS